MSSDHTFCGTWEITECQLNGEVELIGLEGIKFRLDEMGDITWYSDLIQPQTCLVDSNYISSGNETANVLFSCETFEVMDNTLLSEQPSLIFGAFTGHSIEFKTISITPVSQMQLFCDGWYTLCCKRVKEDESVGQEAPFELLPALTEGFFSDGVIKSSDGVQYRLHSAILRLNGFDCSMSFHHALTSSQSLDERPPPSSPNSVKISIVAPKCGRTTTPEVTNKPITNFLLSPNLLFPPNMMDSYMAFPNKLANTLSSSFNCLTLVGKEPSNNKDFLQKYQTSSSDSNLQTSISKNIFNFNDLFLHPTTTTIETRRRCGKPPLSPYRPKSPMFPSSLDTPPSSPLTPIAVLQNLPSAMLSPIIHWLYAECLPADLDEHVCEKLVDFSDSTVPLNKMVEPVRKYMKLISLKKFVISLTMDMHDCLNKMIRIITPANVSHEASILCHTFKKIVREAAVGCAKALQLCHMFVRDASDISRIQRHEIIKHVKSRLPIFLSQLHQLLKNILVVLTSLSDSDKMDLASYLVPEIEITMTVLMDLVYEMKTSLEQMCQDLKQLTVGTVQRKPSRRGRPTSGEFRVEISTSAARFEHTTPKDYKKTENDLKFVLYMYELRKMRDIYGKITSALDIIQQKRILFNEMSDINRENTVRQNLEQLISEIPNYIYILENVADSLDERMGWKEFKFCFKLATSQINGVISKVLDHRPALNDAIFHICKLVQRQQFTEAIFELGLLDANANCLESDLDDYNSEKRLTSDFSTVKLNFIKHLCEPPLAAQSMLSKNALRLLHSGHLADMEFEVIATQDSNDAAKCDIINRNEFIGGQVHIFKAHRVIVSARCEWFRKALTSGMQESITRKITIRDASPVIFRRLLLYLYGAPIDKTVGAEQICELMLLADHYSVVELKDICERTLKSMVDENSVLCLLDIADRFSADALKVHCLSYLSRNIGVTKCDMFLELPSTLQNEVEDLIHWCGRVPEPWSDNPICSQRPSSRQPVRSPSRASKTHSRKSSPSAFM